MLIVLGREKVSLGFTFEGFLLMFAFAVISLLLQHEPDKRPTALELSQSPLLPSRLEDEYFKGALRMIGWFRSLMLL
jgi:hypothetical protein